MTGSDEEDTVTLKWRDEQGKWNASTLTHAEAKKLAIQIAESGRYVWKK